MTMNTIKLLLFLLIINCFVPFYTGVLLDTFSNVIFSSDDSAIVSKALYFNIQFNLTRGLSNNESIVIRLPRFYGTSNYNNDIVLSPSNVFTAVWVRKN